MVNNIELPDGFELDSTGLKLMYRESGCCGDPFPKPVECIAGITKDSPPNKMEALIIFGDYLKVKFYEQRNMKRKTIKKKVKK